MNAARTLAVVAIGIATVLAGCGGSDRSSGGAENQAPVASFVAAPDNGPAPLQVQFDASASRDAEGPVASYSWNFGDDTPTVSGVTASHVFQVIGTYPVTLIVKDSGGASASTTRQMTVSEPVPATVGVPNVVGMTQADATAAIGSAGLSVGVVTFAANATVAVGSVISQAPNAGTFLPRNSPVNLSISSGPNISNGRFSIWVEPAEIEIPSGSRKLLAVSLTRVPGFADPVRIGMVDLPAGIRSEVLTLYGTLTTAYLPVRVESAHDTGSVTINVRAESAGAIDEAPIAVRVAPAEPRTEELIESALMSGKIDYGTSLLYRVYAFFGDRRLPDEYWGVVSTNDGRELFREVRDRLDDLSTDTRAALRPFLVRPADPESVWSAVPQASTAASKVSENVVRRHGGGGDRRWKMSTATAGNAASDWVSERSSAFPLKVWARSDDPDRDVLIARTLRLLERIYQPMVDFMGPLVIDVEGGDSSIDFYLINPGDYVYRRNDTFGLHGAPAATNWDLLESGKAKSSSFVVLNRNDVVYGTFHSTLIHEFFHVLQNAHNRKCCSRSYKVLNDKQEETWQRDAYWFEEASAAWAEAHFDREIAGWEDGRQAGGKIFGELYSDGFRYRLDVPLNASSRNTPDPKWDIYEAFTWPYFVELQTKNATFMKTIWTSLESGVTDMSQADDLVDGVFSFAENFKTFALTNVNKDVGPLHPLPKEKRYVALDSIFPDGEPPMSGVELGERMLVADQEVAIDLSLPNLTAKYASLQVGDPGIRKVELDFAAVQPASDFDVIALIQNVDGEWIEQPFDYSEEGELRFCFDNGPTTTARRGSFNTMVLVLANHSMEKDSQVSGTLRVRPSATPCDTVWKGTFKWSFVAELPPAGRWTMNGTARAIFEFNADPYAWATFKLRDGDYKYEHYLDSVLGECRTQGAASGLMVPAEAPLQVGDTVAGIKFQQGQYNARGETHVLSKGVSNCNDRHEDEPFELVTLERWWKMGGWELVPDGSDRITGAFEEVIDNETSNWEWTLEKVRE